uniref:Uncharacterized protein AlNc14C20G2070 n=1 Tax=Albugo laibachii Nc14 TaxID=890382 RepID=F0W5A4_9STRA|nr:conserved hypothetical protein [Albugo laibachii Nc14]|eukprot:CCA16295.1 conserved hypothetical protein [Albugo laibachii Nc14]
MKILLVNAYPSGSKRGQEAFLAFRQYVVTMLRDEITMHDVTSFEIIERSRQELNEFLFEVGTEHSNDPESMTRFDRLDFVFIDGEISSFLPWAPINRKVTLLTKMCMLTGKCWYGTRVGAALLAYLTSTAGELLDVVNSDGKERVIKGTCVPALKAIDSHQLDPNHLGKVVLDTKTGDYYAFDRAKSSWSPRGNTGLICYRRVAESVLHTAAYKYSPNQAFRLGRSIYCSKKGDLRAFTPSNHLHHSIFRPRGVTKMSSEFLVNCTSKFDLDDRINNTGSNKYQVLIDSIRGPMLIEFGNCVGSHFSMAPEYPESFQIVKNFIGQKLRDLMTHNYLDQSVPTTLRRSLIFYPEHPRQKKSTSRGAEVRYKASIPSSIAASKYSELRPSPRRQSTNRLTYSHSQPDCTRSVSYSSKPVTESSSKAFLKTQSGKLGKQSVETGISNHSAPSTPPLIETLEGWRTEPDDDPPIRISQPCRDYTETKRVSQKVGGNRSKSTLQRNRTQEEKESYYSIVNDGPYISRGEKELLERQKNKLKWIGGPFRVAIGSKKLDPQPSIFARSS